MDTRKGITLEYLKTGAAEDGDCGNPTDKKPAWLDMEKFKRGQEFFQKHMCSIVTSWHVALVPGFAIVNLLVPLVFTNNSDTPDKSFKRYAQTFYHLFQWLGDPTIWDGKSSRGFRSISIVRKMHGNVGRAMNKKLGDKKYVNQYDMGLVQFGFMGAIILYPENYGVDCTKEDLDDYIHLWHGLGYLLGIDDKFNICRGNYQQTYDMAKEIEQKILFPALADRPKDYDKMSMAYIDGLNQNAGFLATSRDSLFALNYEAVGMPIPPMGLSDWARFYWHKLLMFLIRCVPGVRWFMNRRIQDALPMIMAKLFGQKEEYMHSYHKY